MAATKDPGQQESRPGRQHAPRPKRSRRERSKSVALLLLAVVITVFAVLNVEQVKVDWIVGSGRAPLIVVIVISLLVGIVLGHFAGRRSGRRR
jgi:uncharacterized integral membrane protein